MLRNFQLLILQPLQQVRIYTRTYIYSKLSTLHNDHPQAKVFFKSLLCWTSVCVRVLLQVINYYTKFLYTALPCDITNRRGLSNKHIVKSCERRTVSAIYLTINAILFSVHFEKDRVLQL